MEEPKPADPVAAAKTILDAMLGYLGFVVEVREDESSEEPALQVYTEEAERLVGRRGERLDDIQYLLNRLLQARIPGAPRVRLDVEHFRNMREDQFLERIRELADRVRTTGRPVKLQPLNAYYRRLVHQAFKDDPQVTTVSPNDTARVKRIALVRRSPTERSR